VNWTKPLSEYVVNPSYPSERELAGVEALRAIAEELEKLNGLLERVLAGELRITRTDEPNKRDPAYDDDNARYGVISIPSEDEPAQTGSWSETELERVLRENPNLT
jgi:hypothetical protein